MIKIIQRSKATRLKFDHDGVLSLKRTSELIRHYLILQVSLVLSRHIFLICYKKGDTIRAFRSKRREVHGLVAAGAGK